MGAHTHMQGDGVVLEVAQTLDRPDPVLSSELKCQVPGALG